MLLFLLINIYKFFKDDVIIVIILLNKFKINIKIIKNIYWNFIKLFFFLLNVVYIVKLN